ncbi:hypothetical protein C8J57DRAFT_1221294 [Mycena rebaudengoi]|nr:hypothetical protein C8J57DRAFT_1221294 [Mycena rebaudengoi]
MPLHTHQTHNPPDMLHANVRSILNEWRVQTYGQETNKKTRERRKSGREWSTSANEQDTKREHGTHGNKKEKRKRMNNNNHKRAPPVSAATAAGGASVAPLSPSALRWEVTRHALGFSRVFALRVGAVGDVGAADDVGVPVGATAQQTMLSWRTAQARAPPDTCRHRKRLRDLEVRELHGREAREGPAAVSGPVGVGVPDGAGAVRARGRRRGGGARGGRVSGGGGGRGGGRRRAQGMSERRVPAAQRIARTRAKHADCAQNERTGMGEAKGGMVTKEEHGHGGREGGKGDEAEGPGVERVDDLGHLKGRVGFGGGRFVEEDETGTGADGSSALLRMSLSSHSPMAQQLLPLKHACALVYIGGCYWLRGVTTYSLRQLV